jgi:hypothetical protein
MGKHCSFHHKTLWIATVLQHGFFSYIFLCFFIIFFKIVSVDFIFLILTLLRI